MSLLMVPKTPLVIKCEWAFAVQVQDTGLSGLGILGVQILFEFEFF